MPSRMLESCRPRWWTELPLIIVVYALYSTARTFARGDGSTAVEHGVALLRLERPLGLDWETGLNALFTEHAWLGVPADFAYASLHYLITPAVLVWLYRRRPAHYRVMRTWLLGSTVLGLIGFTLMPTSPPRLLSPGHGFIDTMAQYSGYGWWGGEASAPRGLGGATNQFAAMPSLHVAWALWCGVALWLYGRRTPLVRGLALAYPAGVTVVVMGTANHYLLDAVAGAAVLGLGLLLTRPLLALPSRLPGLPNLARRRRTADEPEAPVTAVPADAVAADTTSVGAGCQTSGRTARTAISREATADDHRPGRSDGVDGQNDQPAPTAH